MSTPPSPTQTPLQRLMAAWLAEHPGESLSSIARRGGLPRQTVAAIATRRRKQQQRPTPQTLEGLAKGMLVPVSHLQSVLYATASAPDDEVTTEVTSILRLLDDERRQVVLLRARAMLREQQEAGRG